MLNSVTVYFVVLCRFPCCSEFKGLVPLLFLTVKIMEVNPPPPFSPKIDKRLETSRSVFPNLFGLPPSFLPGHFFSAPLPYPLLVQ